MKEARPPRDGEDDEKQNRKRGTAACTSDQAPETARGRDSDSDGHLGFILNVTYVAEPDSGRAVVHLYGRLADGRPFLVRDRRPEPYFYVESNAVEQAQALGLCNLDPTDRRTLHGAPVHRVRLRHPRDAAEIRARLHRAGAPTYEADVRFAYRYLIDRGIKSALLIHGAARSLDPAATGAKSESADRRAAPERHPGPESPAPAGRAA